MKKIVILFLLQLILTACFGNETENQPTTSSLTTSESLTTSDLTEDNTNIIDIEKINSDFFVNDTHITWDEQKAPNRERFEKAVPILKEFAKNFNTQLQIYNSKNKKAKAETDDFYIASFSWHSSSEEENHDEHECDDLCNNSDEYRAKYINDIGAFDIHITIADRDIVIITFGEVIVSEYNKSNHFLKIVNEFYLKDNSLIEAVFNDKFDGLFEHNYYWIKNRSIIMEYGFVSGKSHTILKCFRFEDYESINIIKNEYWVNYRSNLDNSYKSQIPKQTNDVFAS